jgi:hypothetical protein
MATRVHALCAMEQLAPTRVVGERMARCARSLALSVCVLVCVSAPLQAQEELPPPRPDSETENVVDEGPACTFAQACATMREIDTVEKCEQMLPLAAACFDERYVRLFCGLVCAGRLLPRSCAMGCRHFFESSPNGPYGMLARIFLRNSCRSLVDGTRSYRSALDQVCNAPSFFAQ